MGDKTLNIKIQRNVLLIVIVMLLCIGYFGWTKIGDLDRNIAISEQNIKALNDSVRVSKTKNGKLEYSINTLISDKSDLGKLSENLANQLKNEKGKVHELNQIVANIKPNDTIVITNTIIKYPNGDCGLAWKYDTTYDKNNFRRIEGESQFRLDKMGVIPMNTYITKDEVNFNLITGLREKDGNVEIFANSNYPNLVITNLEGAIIDPKTHPLLKKFTKQKRWGVGPYVGVGVNSNLTFNMQVGVGITMSLIRF